MEAGVQLAEDFEQEKKFFVEEILLPFLEEKGFSFDSVSALPTFLDIHIGDYIADYCTKKRTSGADKTDLNPDLFLIRFSDVNPSLEAQLNFCLGIDDIYGSEVSSDYRILNRPNIRNEDEPELVRFSLLLNQEPFAYFMDLGLFKKFLSECSDFSQLGAQEIQTIRRTAIHYFEDIFYGNTLSDETAADTVEGFVDYFLHTQKAEPVLNFRSTKNLHETLWFLDYMKLSTDELSDYFLTCHAVAKAYLGVERGHEAKHMVRKDGTERASPFEHFMGVTRLMLGAIDSLTKNSAIFGNTFLDGLKSRPDYLLEAVYTALLHDVVEDKKMTLNQVRAILIDDSGLKSGLIDQILDNLELLNAKRINIKTGEKITLQDYVQEILESDNPVVLLVKYADIIHNSKSESGSKWLWPDKPDVLSPAWLHKQKTYEPIIARMNQEPLHTRRSELVAVVSENPELVTNIEAWKNWFNQSPDREQVIAELPTQTQQRIETALAA